MTPQQETRIKDIISDRLNKAPIYSTHHIKDDLGADSLDAVELIMSFEDEFSIEIPDEDAEKLKTVKDIMNYLNDKI